MGWWLTKGQKYNTKVFRAHTSSILQGVLVSTASLGPLPSTPGLLPFATWAQKSPSTTHHQPCMQMYPPHLKSRPKMPRHLKGCLPCDLHIHQYLMILWKVWFMIHLVLFIGLACNTHSCGGHIQTVLLCPRSKCLHIEIAKHVYEPFTKHGPYKFLTNCCRWADEAIYLVARSACQLITPTSVFIIWHIIFLSPEPVVKSSSQQKNVKTRAREWLCRAGSS
jgi:hypothetical protein